MEAPTQFVISPLTLAEIITIFGDRPDPWVGERVRFPLRGCRARAHVVGDDRDSFYVDIEDLGFKGIGFTTCEPLEPSDALVIEFSHLGIPRQVWSCAVIRVTCEQEGMYRVGATFEPGPEG